MGKHTHTANITQLYLELYTYQALPMRYSFHLFINIYYLGLTLFQVLMLGIQWQAKWTRYFTPYFFNKKTDSEKSGKARTGTRPLDLTFSILKSIAITMRNTDYTDLLQR